MYKSLDVGTRYFSTITNSVIVMTLGHVVTLPLGACCNTLTVEQIGRIFGVNGAKHQSWQVTFLLVFSIFCQIGKSKIQDGGHFPSNGNLVPRNSISVPL